DQPHVSGPQMMMEFENGNFRFTFPNPQNASEFSMTLLKGHKKKEICALHFNQGKFIPKSNVTYCQTECSNSSTTFILKNLERKHIDIYTYCLEMLFPPPYIDCQLKETYFYIQDKEDCISLGLIIIIGLIMFAMICCICCVVAYCLRNKNQQCESKSHEYNSEYMPMAAVNAAKTPRI
ncbi:ICOS protein, partial [Ramphastos sulfuratus]|nr:ICOS protein [Ramphastos sulfuratus]